jgi:RimJ/RimL family protein N-acetyltransferase
VRPDPIVTPRLRLVLLEPDHLRAMLAGETSSGALHWPEGWPDAEDRGHVQHWSTRPVTPWGPRALVSEVDGMVGHAGFHRAPRPIDEALDDPTFDGAREPCEGGVVELGYTVLAAWRRRGLAVEAASALVERAFESDEVGAVVASVATTNQPSLGVLARVGGFREIGTCVDDDGEPEIVFRRDR